jgi:hypothetical protein
MGPFAPLLTILYLPLRTTEEEPGAGGEDALAVDIAMKGEVKAEAATMNSAERRTENCFVFLVKVNSRMVKSLA